MSTREDYEANVTRNMAKMANSSLAQEHEIHALQQEIVVLSSEIDHYRDRAKKPENVPEPLRDRMRFCPYCAAGFEPPDGWKADCCPGCKRAELLQEDAREMAWLLRRCLAEADLTNAGELLGLLTAWTVTHKDEYEPPGSTT